MRPENFKQKHGLTVSEFIDIYIERVGFDKSCEEVLPVLNTAKTYLRLRDLPLVSYKKENPDLYNKIVRLITELEEKIEWYKKHDKSWYKYQIEPFINI